MYYTDRFNFVIMMVHYRAPFSYIAVFIFYLSCLNIICHEKVIFYHRQKKVPIIIPKDNKYSVHNHFQNLVIHP